MKGETGGEMEKFEHSEMQINSANTRWERAHHESATYEIFPGIRRCTLLKPKSVSYQLIAVLQRYVFGNLLSLSLHLATESLD